MSEPISKIQRITVDKKTQKKRDLAEIESALAGNKEAVLRTIDLLGSLNERGILELLNGLFAQGDEVFKIAVQEINKPNNARLLENLVGLAGVLGAVDMKSVKTVTERAANGFGEAAAGAVDEEPVKLFELLGALKDPEINRSIAMLLKFLKGMGKE